MYNSSRIKVLADEAKEKISKQSEMVRRIEELNKKLPMAIKRLPGVPDEKHLATLELIAVDNDVVESLRTLALCGMTICLQDGILAQAQMRINERGELELSSDVTRESLRWFLGLEN